MRYEFPCAHRRRIIQFSNYFENILCFFLNLNFVFNTIAEVVPAPLLMTRLDLYQTNLMSLFCNQDLIFNWSIKFSLAGVLKMRRVSQKKCIICHLLFRDF